MHSPNLLVDILYRRAQMYFGQQNYAKARPLLSQAAQKVKSIDMHTLNSRSRC